jgi:ketosteroid isomerase-like protein
VSDLDVKVYGDTAVAVFQWDFVAIRRDNGETLRTTGRESQVFAHIPGQGWRLIHVHYSGPPKTGIGEGF